MSEQTKLKPAKKRQKRAYFVRRTPDGLHMGINLSGFMEEAFTRLCKEAQITPKRWLARAIGDAVIRGVNGPSASPEFIHGKS